MGKQTAVEWLIDKIYFKQVEVNRELLNQALEMEKQQIIDAWEDGQHSFSSRNAEQYYKETFED